MGLKMRGGATELSGEASQSLVLSAHVDALVWADVLGARAPAQGGKPRTVSTVAVRCTRGRAWGWQRTGRERDPVRSQSHELDGVARRSQPEHREGA